MIFFFFNVDWIWEKKPHRLFVGLKKWIAAVIRNAELFFRKSLKQNPKASRRLWVVC